MSSYDTLNGATRIVTEIGDPIAQVKSPAGITKALQEKGRNAVVIPIHVTTEDLDSFFRGINLAKNHDGMIVTIPHKFAAYRYCATATDRASFLEAVDVIRRNPDGTWHGDMLDGVGMITGILSNGGNPKGKRALLIGTGGAGSAIALALLDSGVSELAIHDVDVVRRDALLLKLRKKFGDKIYAGSSDPTGYELVVNATPMGMRPEDPYPILVDKLAPGSFAACVITAPVVPPWIEAARSRNCKTSLGVDMFTGLSSGIVDFLLEVIP